MPLQRYDAEISQGLLSPDTEQREVMRRLDSISTELAKRSSWKPSSQSVFARWMGISQSRISCVPGLYLWGGVGRGKTHLCDMFFDELPFSEKTRLHFHRFMQQIHTNLRKLEGVENPIDIIADEWASKVRLLLLDEIHVNDITDAMLLGGLLTALFERGVTLVTTSNVPPTGLYKDGLQRARFLPAIAQICKYTNVLEMTGVTDYRLRLLQTEPIYCVSEFTQGRSSKEAQAAMQAHFERLTVEGVDQRESIELNGRMLPLLGRSADLVWFSFDTLCNTPRSTEDYIEIASVFGTVLISDIPVMDEMSSDAARRFVNLIDEFYDRHVKLVVSAEATADKLYVGERLAFEFERAASRLFEMQTTDYLSSGRTTKLNSG